MLTLWILSLEWKVTNNFLVLNKETIKFAVFGQNPQFFGWNDKLGQMVLKGVSWVHNDKNGSNGLESSE